MNGHRCQVKISASAPLRASLKVYVLENGETLGALVRRVLRTHIRNRNEHDGPASTMYRQTSARAIAGESRPVQVWIDRQDVSSLRAFAAEADLSLADIIREVLAAYVRTRQKQTATGGRTGQRPSWTGGAPVPVPSVAGKP
jgi:hypothetical protein